MKLGEIRVMREETNLEKLQAYKYHKIDVDGILEEIVRLRARMERCTVALTPSRTSGGPKNGDKMGDALGRLEELEAFLDRRLQQARGEMEECEAILEKLPHPHREIMRMYYVHEHTWDEVAVRVKYSQAHCKRCAKQAREML